MADLACFVPGSSYTAILQESVLLAMPGREEPRTDRLWL